MADNGAPHELRISKRFFKAAVWAAQRHGRRQRRGGGLSAAQVLGTASLVLEDGGSEREAIAAMLLDALGGNDVPRAELRAAVGKKTCRLVASCADVEAGGGDQAPVVARRDHLAATLERVARADRPVVRVLAAHALREAQTLVDELRRNGSIALARFTAPPAEQLAFWRARADTFLQLMPGSHLARELLLTVTTIERHVELDVATAAWRVAHVDAA